MYFLAYEEKVVLSAKLTKINNVNKKQERVLLLTDRNLYNILPGDTFLSLFTRIKRKIPYSNVRAMTVSRFSQEFVVHVDKEHDYRFSSPTMKLKIVENLVDCYCKYHKKKMPLYYYDDLSLENFTTTIDDVEKKQKKIHNIEPLYLDSESIKKNEQVKPESKLIFKNENTEQQVGSFEEFELLKVLGRGAFGKVMLCQNIKNKGYYAVKSMRKENLIEKEHLEKTRTERILLEKAKHPFLVNLEFAFQTKEKIFFIMNFIRGGEMFTHLRKNKRFPESRAKFYAAQVFMALNYLHKLGYVYRDLKPENILFETDGYLKISDFGLAKFLKPGEKTYSLAGTPDYVSPEVILNTGQTFSTDWWSFGILISEMIYGTPPFYNRDHEKMFQDILNREIFFDNSKVEASPEAKDIIRKLLRKDKEKRLGSENEEEIRNHPWFAGLNF